MDSTAPTLHRAIASDSRPAVTLLIQTLLDPTFPASTLLAVCPNSEAVTEAALLAAHEAQTPLLLAATLNQVDRDGGYTGWRPYDLQAFVAEAQVRLGTDVLVLTGLDHGGPWMRDRDARERLPLDAAMDNVKASIEACLDAGYALLHLDPTADITLAPGQQVPHATVIERTLELLAHAEQYRTVQGLPPVSYEVGTEEVTGGLTDLEAFAAFLAALDSALQRAGYAEQWPVFMVGNVGTDLHSGAFDEARARALRELTCPYGTLLKGHYTDFANDPSAYPRAGMGGANVGPGLAAIEYEAMQHLAVRAEALGRPTKWLRVIDDAVLASGRWRKWVDDPTAAFEAHKATMRHFLLSTGSRYVWNTPAVRAARAALIDRLADDVDGEAYVRDRLRQAILRYMHGFNLDGLNGRLLAYRESSA